MEAFKEEPPEVTEADIYVDLAEADNDAHRASSQPPYSGLPSQTLVPLESGEQSIRLPFQAGGSQVSNGPLFAAFASLKPSGAPVFSNISQPTSSTFPNASASSPAARPVPAGQTDAPPAVHSQPSVVVDEDIDMELEEEVDVDTPYDGRLLIQSASRPNELLRMIPKSLYTARKSTTKAGASSAAPNSVWSSQSKSVAKKSTGGFVPKIVQTARKSTAKQGNTTKASGDHKKKTSKATSDDVLWVKINHSTSHLQTERTVNNSSTASAKTKQQFAEKILARIPAQNGPQETNISGHFTSGPGSARPSEQSQTSSSKSFSVTDKSATYKPGPKCSKMPSAKLTVLSPPSKPPAPEPPLTLSPKQGPQAQVPMKVTPSPATPSYRPGPKSSKKQPSSSAGETSVKNKSAQKTSPFQAAGLSYKVNQKTAYRKGIPEQIPPIAAPHRRPRRASGAGSESSSETSEAQAPAPKKAKLQEADSELNATMALLNEKRELLRSVEQQLASVTASLQTIVENKVKLEAQETKVEVCLVSLETAVRPFDCKTCTEAFQLALACPRAFRQHGKDKPFHCKHCTAAFTHQGLLEEHIDWHISDKVAVKQAFQAKAWSQLPMNEDASDAEFERETTPERAVSSRTRNSDDVNKLEEPSPGLSAVSAQSVQSRKFPVVNDQKLSPDKESTSRSTVDKTISGQSPKKTRPACHFCGKQFDYYCYLAKHMKVHTSIYTCAYCTKCFASKSAIIEHTAKDHSGKNLNVSCKFCWKQYRYLSEFERHVIVHTSGVRNQCTVCGKKYNWIKNVVRHMHDAHREQQSTSALRTMLTQGEFQCMKCGKSFMQATSLVQHDDHFHAESSKEFEEQSRGARMVKSGSKVTRQTVSQQDGEEQPREADPSASKRASLDQRKKLNSISVKKVHHKASISRQKVASQLSARARQRKKGKGLWSCKMCGSPIGTRKGLAKHIRHFHPDCYTTENLGFCRNFDDKGGPYRCSVCSKVFLFRHRLVLHMKDFHPTKNHQTCIKCMKCGVEFGAANSLLGHIFKAHPPTMKKGGFQCALCPKVFRHRPSVNRHVRNRHVVASGAPTSSPATSKVTIADKATFASASRTSPAAVKKVQKQKTVPPRTSLIKSGKCHVCSKRFSEKSTLYKHMRASHPGIPCFQCFKCGQGFQFVREYLDHQCPSELTEDCRYRCLTCGMGFHIAREWTRHMQEHAAESGVPVDGLGESGEQITVAVMSPADMMVKTEHFFRCMDCGDTFDNEDAWGKHMCAEAESSSSRVNDDPAENSSDNTPRQTNATSGGPVKCTLCNRMYSVHSIRKHCKNIHQKKIGICKICGQTFIGSSLKAYKTHLQEHKEKPQTTVVDRSAEEETDGSQESKGPLASRNFLTCVSEPADSGKKSPLLIKIKVEPGTIPESQYPTAARCTVCSKMFSPLYIKMHMRQVHSLRALRCKKCGEDHMDQLSFDRHMLQHREEELLADYKQTDSTSGTPDAADAEKLAAGSADIVTVHSVLEAGQQPSSIIATDREVSADPNLVSTLITEPLDDARVEENAEKSAFDLEDHPDDGLNMHQDASPKVDITKHVASSGSANTESVCGPGTVTSGQPDEMPVSPAEEVASSQLQELGELAGAAAPSDMAFEELPAADLSDADVAEDVENGEQADPSALELANMDEVDIPTNEPQAPALDTKLAEIMASSPVCPPEVPNHTAVQEAALHDSDIADEMVGSAQPDLSELEYIIEAEGINPSELELLEQAAISLNTAADPEFEELSGNEPKMAPSD